MPTKHFFSGRLRFGDLDLTSAFEGEEKIAQEVKILDITKHPRYKTGQSYFDVAVLEMEEVQFTEAVRPICLPDSRDFVEDKYEGVTIIFCISTK